MPLHRLIKKFNRLLRMEGISASAAVHFLSLLMEELANLASFSPHPLPGGNFTPRLCRKRNNFGFDAELNQTFGTNINILVLLSLPY